MTIIYQPSDLNQRGRAILDAARRGQARIRDKDGTSLLVVPEERIEALETAARYVANLLTIEDFISPHKVFSREFISLSSWPWLAYLDDDDIEQFVVELRRSLLAATNTGNTAPTEQLINEWRITAEELSDPIRRRTLLEPFDPSAYVEVQAPGTLSSSGTMDSTDQNDPASLA